MNTQECIFKCKEGYKGILELDKKELVYDIKNTAFIFAHSLSEEVSDVAKHNVYEVGEEGNRDKVARLLDEAVEDCREMLFMLTRVHCTSHDLVEDSDAWEKCVGAPKNEMDCYYLYMIFPYLASHTTLHTLAVYVHNYIVNKVMYQWMLLAYPSGAENFAVMVSDLEERIKKAATRPAGRSRIVPHMFS